MEHGDSFYPASGANESLGRTGPAALLPLPSPSPPAAPAAPHRLIPALLSYRRHAGPRVGRLGAAGTSLPGWARGEEGVECLLADHPGAEEEANTRRLGTREAGASTGGLQLAPSGPRMLRRWGTWGWAGGGGEPSAHVQEGAAARQARWGLLYSGRGQGHGWVHIYLFFHSLYSLIYLCLREVSPPLRHWEEVPGPQGMNLALK